ncbi:fasciclin-like arabinogalactan protein 7 [Iris pallida]|uniref:Fasciclin-like arabinogalactan protein 7 n=1 Tax=Iris pallida TaxID=29817 RepID=A0AAX6EJM9_IRIPA|nr:fasciclin-like arabinogalactan protein 7 [Iris pallida]
MALTTVLAVATLLVLSVSTPAAAQAASPPAFSPAPAPAPEFVNLTNLLTVAGPFHTFLNYLTQTQVLQTFQNQANNTDQGVTIFVPKDSAFSAIKKPAFANLTGDQLKSLLLLHALPKYYSLAEFRNLSNLGPVSTFAGGQYTMNLTDDSGTIRLQSGWANTKVTSSVWSAYPVAVYEVDRVLLPKAIFAVDPPLAPAPAPTPEAPVADVSPAPSKGKVGAPKPSEDSTNSGCMAGGFGYMALAISGALMFMV